MPYSNANVGGPGDQSGAHVDNGGFYISSAAWGDVQDANGGPAVSLGACTITSGGGAKCRLTPVSGNVAGAVVGSYSNVDFVADYTDGHYNITAVDGSDAWLEINLSYNGGNNQNVTTAICGGALSMDSAGLQIACDLLPDVGADIIQICVGEDPGGATGTVDIDAVVDIDTVSGFAAARITIEGVDISGVGLTVNAVRPILLASANLVGASGGMFEISGTTTYWDWRMLDMDGGDTGANNTAEACIYCNDATSDYHRFFNCKFHNTEYEAFYWKGDYVVYVAGEIYDADKGGGGVPAGYIFATRATVLSSSFHDNADAGLECSSSFGASIIGNLLYDNSGNGLEVESQSTISTVANNTVYGNGGVGIFIDSSASDVRCFNNTSSGNTGFNWDLDNDATRFAYFGFNHEFAGGGAVDDSFTWADIGEGNNTTGDPLFTDPANGEFRMQDFEILMSGIPEFGGRASFIGAVMPELGGPVGRRQRYSGFPNGYRY